MIQNDNQQKQDMQKRILIATLLAFVFFIAYDYLYVQPQQIKSLKQEVKVSKSIDKSTPIMDKIDTPKQSTNNIPILKQIDKKSIISTIKTKDLIYEIDSLGRIAQVTLTHKQYIDKDKHALKMFNNKQLRPLEVRFKDPILNEEAFKIPVVANLKDVDVKSGITTLVLTQTLSKTILTKTIKFYPDGHYDLDIATSNNQEYFVTTGFRPDIQSDMYTDHGALLMKNDGTLIIIEDEDMESEVKFVGINTISSFDRYYTNVLYNFNKNMEVTVMMDKDKSPQSFIHINNSIKLSGYNGPKEYDLIKSFNLKLTDIIEYGWFSFIAKPMFNMLNLIYSIVGNWGWTIIIATILIKLVLSPLAFKGMVSMNRLKELAPKIKAIQEKNKNDKQKASMQMMELYKKEGANPMGGCLPIILQIPVFFAIYRVLLNSIELKGAPWIWFVQDLTHKVSMSNLLDPYILIPIIMGFTMYIQQKITPTQIQDEAQRKVFMMLPVIFTVFFIFFEAGLVIYWTINNIFTISQQYYVNNIFSQKNKEKKAKKK